MPLRHCALLLVLVCLHAETYSLQTPRMTVELASDGAIVQITDRRSGQQFIATPKPLFDLILSMPPEAQPGAERLGGADGPPITRVENQALPPKLVFQRVGPGDFTAIAWDRSDPRRWLVRYQHHRRLGLEVAVTLAVDDEGNLACGWAATGIPAQQAIHLVAFPQFLLRPTLGADDADDHLLWPSPGSEGGVLLRSPARRDRQAMGKYPGWLPVQLQAYYDDRAGLYLACHDPGGHVKRHRLATIAKTSVEMKIEHLVPEIPGASHALPYPVVLTTFQGDWYDAAERYKAWASQQHFCAKKIAERDDLPAFLGPGSGLLIENLRDANDPDRLGKNLERLPGRVADFRRATGLDRVVVALFGFEKQGSWAGIDYFPPHPSESALRRACSALRRQGDAVDLHPSSFWWVIKRRDTRFGPAFDDTADAVAGQDMLTREPDGSIRLLDLYDRAEDKNGGYQGQTVALCHGCAQAQRTVRDIYVACARLGADMVAFDQELGGGQMFPCYHPGHGHPPGHGPWMLADLLSVADAIRAEVGQQPGGFAVTIEKCGEGMLQRMQTFYNRSHCITDHHLDDGAAIGLFPYLYHEYLPLLSAPPLRDWKSYALRRRSLAVALTQGLIPGLYHWEWPEPTDTPRPYPTAVGAAFTAYAPAGRSAPEFLHRGRCVRPPAITCADDTIPIGTPTLDTASDEPPLRLPSVIAGSFVSADGHIGTILVNATDKPQKAVVATTWTGRPAELQSRERRRQQSWPSLPPRIELSLEPLGVRWLVIGP